MHVFGDVGPKRARAFTEIVQQTGATIVLSSEWRRGRTPRAAVVERVRVPSRWTGDARRPVDY